MRGRPPESNSKVGHVTWEEEFSCFVGSCGYYWHGHKFGGWQNEPPDPKRKRPASSGGGVSGSGNVDRVCRGRRPNGNERIGVIITYNIEHDCYQTEKEYYWHGTYNGGWKKNAPGVDSDVESEAENEEEEKKEDDPNVDVVVVDRPSKKKRKGNTKGRPPRKQIAEETIEYDAYKLCWTTTREGGLYWHGTYKGGWKDYPPKQHIKLFLHSMHVFVSLLHFFIDLYHPYDEYYLSLISFSIICSSPLNFENVLFILY